MKRPYNFKNLIDQIFGRLTVIGELPDVYYPSGARRVQWKCMCECGKETNVLACQLTSGKTKSCGCLKNENLVDRVFKHGMTKTNEYMIWAAIKDRCRNPNNKKYDDYGGRGIFLQKSWEEDFLKFYNYVGPKPGMGYSIDRIDNNKGYEEGNVRWATTKEQRNNQRKVRGKNRFKYVAYHKASGSYTGGFKFEDKRAGLPLHSDEEEQARRVYLKYREMYGEFPRYIEEDLIYLGLLNESGECDEEEDLSEA